MNIVDPREAKRRLSELLERAANGEEVIIAKAGRPIARLIGFRREHPDRVGAQWEGLVNISDEFDDPLPEDLTGTFGASS